MKSLARIVMVIGFAPLAIIGCEPEPGSDASRPLGVADASAEFEPIPVEGRQVYETYCAGCHGVDGDGNGKAAVFMHPKPRNFQTANFKFSSTRSGQLPTDEDLRRTIAKGLRGSAMPGWNFLPQPDLNAVIAHIKTFSSKWQERSPAGPIPFVDDPYRSRKGKDKHKAIERGEVVYHGFATCWTCHPAYVSTDRVNEHLAAMDNPTRDAFRADFSESVAKPNEEGELIYPPDFKRDYVRAGASANDLYRSIAAGITGTAMPTWGDSMSFTGPDGKALVEPADIWAMAYYVQELIRNRPAKLAAGSFEVRNRPLPLYLHGTPPQTVQPPRSVGAESMTDEPFDEDE